MPLLLPNLQDWYCCRRLAAAAAALWLPSHWIGSDSATMHAVVVALYRISSASVLRALHGSNYRDSIQDVRRRLALLRTAVG